MKNFGEMVEETQSYLRSFVRDQEMSTHLTSDIGFSDLTIPVADAAALTRGRIQIDDELIWIDAPDRSTGVGLAPPYGRGMDGTNKADHKAGTRVVVQPLYPRKLLKDTLNQAIVASGLRLYGIEKIALPGRATSFMYELPSYTRDVLSVRMESRGNRMLGDGPVWLRDWTFDKHSPANISTTGKAVYLYDGRCGMGEDVSVVISRDPAILFFDVQMFTDSFLPETAWDVVVLTAASRLLATADAYNIVGRSVEANTLDSKVTPNSAVAQSKYLYQLAQARLEEERSKLLNSTMQRAHYSRRG